MIIFANPQLRSSKYYHNCFIRWNALKARRPGYLYLDKSKIEKALDIKVCPWQEMLKTYFNIDIKLICWDNIPSLVMTF